MVTVVIPFAGAEGKTRLHPSRRIRRALARAMFCDVLAACAAVGRTRVVTPDAEAAAAALEAGAETVSDPGGGQGAAVQAALQGLDPGGILVVAGAAATSVIGNVGDDVEVLGLHVSPDLDSILYALAGVADERRGWGRSDETWRALETAGALGGENWFALGDRDLGLHLVRTQALRAGEPLSAVTARLAVAIGVEARLFPATDDRLRTWLDTPAGTFPFQEWFVARRHGDEVDAVRFGG